VEFDDEEHYNLQYVCYLFEACSLQLQLNNGEDNGFDDCKELGQSLPFDATYYRPNARPKLPDIVQLRHTKEGRRKELSAIRTRVMKEEGGDIHRARPRIAELSGPLLAARRHPTMDVHRRAKRDAGTAENANSTCIDYDDSDCSPQGSQIDDMDEDNEFACYCPWNYCNFIDYDLQAWMKEDASDWDDWWTDRVWYYQQCTEWGFLISVNYGRNIFMDSISVK
jgi:hypothetical protein